MIDAVLALHAHVVADLRVADELGLIDIGIDLDSARLHLDRWLAEFHRQAALAIVPETVTD